VLTWTERGVATQWEIEYGVAGFRHGTGTIADVNTNPTTIAGLTPNTIYDAYVRSICDEENKSDWSKKITFRTAQISATLPYICNFEDNEENTNWTFENGSQANKWHIGSAVNNGGENSLYISNDNGVSNIYSDVTSSAFAYRTLTFLNSGVYSISFDWKAMGIIVTYGGGGSSYYSRDFLKVFLAPINANLTPGIDISDFETPSGWIDLGKGVLQLSNSWVNNYLEFNLPTAGDYNLVFYWSNGASTLYTIANPPAAIDNIYLKKVTCNRPENLLFSNITNTTVEAMWIEKDTATQWEMEYGITGFKQGTGTIIAVNSNPATISELTSNTIYDFYVRAVCSEDNKSEWSLKNTFQTKQTLAPCCPYSHDFEDDVENAEWTLFNTTGNNKWYIGSAPDVNNTTSDGATKGLYISNNNGVTNIYNSSSKSYAYAYRTISFDEPAVYTISYDWKSYGNMDYIYDHLLVFFVPEGIKFENYHLDLVSSWGIVFGNKYPAGWINVGIDLGIVSSWRNKISEFTIQSKGNYNLVFIWENSLGGADPPAAVDNINIEKITCPFPVSLSVSKITHESADLTWTERYLATQWEIEYGVAGFQNGTGTVVPANADSATISELVPNTFYDVYVRSVCGEGQKSEWSKKATFRTLQVPQIPAKLPYIHNFETNSENANWALENGDQTNKWHIGLTVNNGGTQSLYISDNDGTGNTYTNKTSYVYAYRKLSFDEATFYSISFDWKSQGKPYDVLRVFLVPENVLLTAGNANGMTGSSNTVPSGWIALDGGLLHNSAEWQTKSTEFVITTAGNYHLVFFWRNENDVGYVFNPPAAVDNIHIWKIICPDPVSLSVFRTTDESASLTWTERGTATKWEIEYGVSGFLQGTGDIVIANADSSAITGLMPNTIYDAYVRTVCSETDKSGWSQKVTFCTAQIPATLPYIHNFENNGENANWTLENGSQTNKWHVGSAVNNSGEKSLYISNDDGVSNAYSISSATSHVYAYRTLNFDEAADYSISFDWKANGEDRYDLLRAFLVPANISLIAGDANEMTGSSNGTPSGWIALDGGILCTSSTWQTKLTKLTIEIAGNYNLVFFWKNDGSGGSNPPAAVDNIHIKKLIPPPLATLPYTQNFEDNEENANWILENSNQTNKWYIGSAVNNGGGKSLYISSDNGTSNTYNTGSTSYVYAYRTLNFDEAADYSVNFDWKANGENNYDVLRVFLVPVNVLLTAGNANGMTGNYNTTSSGWIALDGGILCSSSAWQTKSTKLTIATAGNYNLVFFWKNDDSSGSNPPAAIDNIHIKKLIPPPPATLPYIHNFEDNEENANWILENDNQTNKWHIGLAVNYSGEKSLYISNNNGTSNTYSNNSTSYVYAYRTLRFDEANNYFISFVWQAQGENNYDVLRAFLVPANVPLTAGNANGMADASNIPPSGWIALDGGPLSGRSTAWSSNAEYTSREIIVPAAGDYNLVFFWKNDGSGGSNPPAAVDNIHVTKHLRRGYVSNITPYSVDLTFPGYNNPDVSTWDIEYGVAGFKQGNGTTILKGDVNKILANLTPNTQYEIIVRYVDFLGSHLYYMDFVTAQVAATLPYRCNFDNYAENNQWTMDRKRFDRYELDRPLNWVISYQSLSAVYIEKENNPFYSYNASAYRTLNFSEPGPYKVDFDWKFYKKNWGDLFRVFLIPEDVYAFSIDRIYLPNGAIAIDGNILNHWMEDDSWHKQSVEFTIPETGRYNLYVYYEGSFENSTNPSENTPAGIGNVYIRRYGCIEPVSLSVSAITYESTTLTWQEKGQATQWEIQYGVKGFMLGNGTIISVDEKPAMLSNLLPNTTYDVYVRAVCSESDKSDWSVKASFVTLAAQQIPATLPYVCKFEDEEENARWTLLTANSVSQWYIGTATNNTAEGIKSLYISNDNGKSNNYFNGGSSLVYVYAYRTIHFAEMGDYTLHFEWRSAGERDYDVLRAFLVPESVTLTAGNANGMTGNINTPPSGWIALDGGQLSLSSEWNTRSATFIISTSGNYNLVFFWKNNASNGTNPPAAVDNISVTKTLDSGGVFGDPPLAWKYENGTLTISGNGEIPSVVNKPWLLFRNEITTIILEEGITAIGDTAFARLPNLTGIVIPASVKDIGESAWWQSGQLSKIILLGETPPDIKEEIKNFVNVNNITLYCPSEAYITAEGWKEFPNQVFYHNIGDAIAVTSSTNSLYFEWMPDIYAEGYILTVYSDEAHTNELYVFLFDYEWTICKTTPQQRDRSYRFLPHCERIGQQYALLLCSNLS
jgi:hypothetical protein